MASGDRADPIVETPRQPSPILQPRPRVAIPEAAERFFESISEEAPRQYAPRCVHTSQKEESLSKWNLNFSGDSCVREFFSRVEEETEARVVTHQCVVRRFHELLSGSALKYFRSIRIPGLEYAHLKAAFYRTFDVTDYDFKIERELRSLKQGSTQTVRDFVINARDLNSRLRTPIDESSLFTIVKYGMHPRFYPCLATNLIVDMDALLQVASNFETFQIASSSTMSVAPLQVETPPLCLKCGEAGHQYRACVKFPGPVCFRCKRPGVITRDCGSCNPPKN